MFCGEREREGKRKERERKMVRTGERGGKGKCAGMKVSKENTAGRRSWRGVRQEE